MEIHYFKEPTQVNVKWNGIEIVDSYKIPHRHYANILNRVEEQSKGHPVWLSRSRWSLECEWAVHNLAYTLGIKRDMAKSVFFCHVLTKWEKFFYHVLGSLLYIWK